jgi:hypothetical protein
MRTTMAILASLTIGVSLLIPELASPTNAQKPTKNKTEQQAKNDPCGEAWGNGFLTALNIPVLTVGEKPKPIPLQILAEEIEGESSYKFAAAEVVRTHFATWFEITPKAKLVLYLGGTKSLDEGYGRMTQGITIELYGFVIAKLAAGDERKGFPSNLVLASKHGFVENGTLETRTQFVREWVYSVLAEFTQKWEAATP